jgi:hypothetical protein|tara:strand:- start:352 stop:549 length:198 start_codon:yes stop_codon:yes gene_type:complete
MTSTRTWGGARKRLVAAAAVDAIGTTVVTTTFEMTIVAGAAVATMVSGDLEVRPHPHVVRGTKMK